MPSKDGQYNLDDFKFSEVRVQLKSSGSVLFSDTPITNSEDAAHLLADRLLRDAPHEYVIMVSLTSQLTPTSWSIVGQGSLSACICHPRSIMQLAILGNAASIMLLHNHPSGFTKPSPEDIELTHRMSKICDLMEIPLLDHIIVGGGDHPQPFYSFRMEGNLYDYDNSSSVREAETEYSTSAITVDYYVHECSEYPELGEQHHGLTLDQAVDVYESIPSNRMNGIKSIGIEIHDPTDRFYDGYTVDLYRGRVIEDALEYSNYLRSQPAVQQAHQAIKDRFAPKEERAAEITTIVPPTATADDNRAVYEAEFGWVRLERYKDGDIHYMTYGKDCWGQEARFVKADGSLPQVARQITRQLYGYSGPLQPVDLDAFKLMLRNAHPERYVDVKEQQPKRHHPRR